MSDTGCPYREVYRHDGGDCYLCSRGINTDCYDSYSSWAEICGEGRIAALEADLSRVRQVAVEAIFAFEILGKHGTCDVSCPVCKMVNELKARLK